MALIFCDGWDWYQGADILKRWTANPGGSVVTSPAYGRAPSGQGARITGGGGVSPCVVAKSFGSNYTAGLVGFAFKYAGASLVSKLLALVIDGATEQISLRTNASSVLTVSRAGTTLATGSTVLATGTWYFVEFKYTINNSAGVVQVKLNGASEIASTSSLDTTNTANAYWNAIGLLSHSSSSEIMDVDDLYLLDTTTGSNTNFLGPVQVIARYPDGNGASSQWTPNGGNNVGAVSEPYQDGATTFSQSSTAGHIDTFTMQGCPVATGTLHAVAVHNVASQDAGAARTVAPVIRIGGTNYAGTAVATSTSWQFLSQHYDQSPATSSAWGLSEWDGAETGFKLVS